MQVSNNIYTNYNQIANTTKPQKTEESTFASMLNSSENIKEEQSGLFLKFMDQYNAFDSLSEKDRKHFKEILKDDKITMAEMDSLSYEQAEKFEYYAYPPATLPIHELNKAPIVMKPNQVSTMLFATRTTNDRAFNEALYKTAREINNDDHRSTVFSEVQTNLSQVHFGFEVLSSFNSGAKQKDLWNEDIQIMNIDFDNFLNDVISLHEKALSNPKTHPAVIKQHEERLDGYNIILKHFNNIKSEPKYV